MLCSMLIICYPLLYVKPDQTPIVESSYNANAQTNPTTKTPKMPTPLTQLAAPVSTSGIGIAVVGAEGERPEAIVVPFDES
jgi:hypothetical protein